MLVTPLVFPIPPGELKLEQSLLQAADSDWDWGKSDGVPINIYHVKS